MWTHKWGQVSCLQIMPGTQRLFPDSDVLVQEHIAEALATREPETLECPARHAVLLHNRMLHTSAVNPTDKPRLAISVSYLDGRTKHNQGKAFSLIFGRGALQPKTVGLKA